MHPAIRAYNRLDKRRENFPSFLYTDDQGGGPSLMGQMQQSDELTAAANYEARQS